MRFRTVFRRDPDAGLFRLFRVIWTRGQGAGVGGEKNYDAAFSVALCRFSFRIKREYAGVIVRAGFIRFHYQRSYGGRLV